MKLWIISDDSHRATQATAIADYLNPDYLILSTHHINRDGGLKNHLENHHPNQDEPDIAIGAGEETASILRDIKLSAPKCFTVSIGIPNPPYDAYDCILSPSYEPHIDAPQWVTTTGIIHPVTPDTLAQARKEYEQESLPELKRAATTRPIISVLIGGRHIGGNITAKDATRLAQQLNTINKRHEASWWLTSSHRTERETIQSLQQHLTMPYFFYDFLNNRPTPNPYLAMLAMSDAIIVTGDSVRMLSETTATGKPIYIWMPHQGFSPYAALHEELYEKGFAAPLNEMTEEFFQPPPPLNEAKRMAATIKNKAQL